MTDDKWQQLKENLKRKFEVSDDRTEDLLADSADGPVKQGTQDLLIVHTPAGKIKLVREVRPLVIGKKFRYTHRQGQSSTVEYQHSATEKSHRLRLFRWDKLEDDWKELDERNVEGLL